MIRSGLVVATAIVMVISVTGGVAAGVGGGSDAGALADAPDAPDARSLGATGATTSPFDFGVELQQTATVTRGGDVTVSAFPNNRLDEPVTGTTVELLVDADADGQFESGEVVASRSADFAASEYREIELAYTNVQLSAGQYTYMARISKDGHTARSFTNGTLTVEGDGSDDGSDCATTTTGVNRTYGGPGESRFNAMLRLDDCGYVLAGSTSTPNGPIQSWLVKVDHAGNEQWNTTLSGGRTYDVTATSDGGYVLTGADGRITKVDASGTEQWSNTYRLSIGSTEGREVIETADGDYLMAGYSRTGSTGNLQAWLVKVDASGTELWRNDYGRTSHPDAGSFTKPDEEANAVVETSDGYVFVGSTTSSGSLDFADAYLVKVDTAGTVQWTRVLNRSTTSGDDVGHDLLADGNGYTFTGETAPSGTTGSDLWLVRTDGQGVTQWERTFDRSSYEEGRAVAATADGGYVTAGRAGFGGGDAWLVKTDGQGVEAWNLTLAAEFGEVAEDVREIHGGYAFAGHTSSFGPGQIAAWFVTVGDPGPGGDDGDEPFDFGVELQQTATVTRGGDVNVSAFPNNRADQPVSDTTVELLVDADADGRFEASEVVASRSADFAASEYREIELAYTNVQLSAGNYRYMARISKDGQTTRSFTNGTLTVQAGGGGGGPDVGGTGVPARDHDGDGLYEDVNGDGDATPGDATVLFNAVFEGDPAVTGNTASFDFNADGSLTPGDATVLFDRIFG